MEFDPNNKVIKLCIEGIQLEGENQFEAKLLYEKAWSLAETDLERFSAAHYLARQQESINEKLAWDETALKFALNIKDDSVKGVLASLYLNIGKCYEDLCDFKNAFLNYQNALTNTFFLNDDGYGKMIKSGVLSGIERVGK